MNGNHRMSDRGCTDLWSVWILQSCQSALNIFAKRQIIAGIRQISAANLYKLRSDARKSLHILLNPMQITPSSRWRLL